MKGLEGLKALAMKPAPAAPAAPMVEEAEDPERERFLGHADDLIAAIKAGDREAVADVLQDCTGGYSEE